MPQADPPSTRRVFLKRSGPLPPASGEKKNQLAISRARQLRKSETDAEAQLWYALRGRRSDGLKFRRQHPVAPYILDFAERSLKLAIEIDGATHMTADERTHDNRRTAFLERKGWTVIRFQNDEVYKELDAVVDAIWRAALDLTNAK